MITFSTQSYNCDVDVSTPQSTQTGTLQRRSQLNTNKTLIMGKKEKSLYEKQLPFYVVIVTKTTTQKCFNRKTTNNLNHHQLLTTRIYPAAHTTQYPPCHSDIFSAHTHKHLGRLTTSTSEPQQQYLVSYRSTTTYCE